MMKTYKIAIIREILGNGGVSIALLEFLKNISDYNCEITLYLKDYDKSRIDAIPSGIIHKPWPIKMNFKQAFHNGGIKSVMDLFYHRLLAKYLFWNYPKQTICGARCYDTIPGQYDCVIGYHMTENDVSVVSLEKTNANRKVLWLHGKKTFLDKNMGLFSRLYSKADQIVTVSKDTEDRFIKLFPELKQKTTTIHNFYDFKAIYQKADEIIDSIKDNDNEIVIVSTGRLSKEKGFDRVPTVTKRLIDDGYNIKWYIAGDGDQKESIASAIKELGLEDHVIMTGFITNPYPYVKQCDIYVQPSYTEGFCTSTMEAKILKRPVVTTDVPGMNEQFTNEYDGLIVESSVDGLYTGIKRMIDDSQLYDSIIQHLNEEEFSNDEEVRKALAVITGE